MSVPSFVVQALAGSDFVGDGGPAVRAALSQAEGIAADGFANLYIADANDHRIRKVSLDGRITTIAGTGRPGFSDNRPAVTAQLQNPYGLALDRTGNLYVADLGNARVRRISPDGLITTVAGGPQSPLVQPRNIAVDFTGNVYISDFGGHRVYRLDRAGVLTAVAGTGVAGQSGDGGLALSAQLSSPAGVAVDPTGAVYIADSGNQRVRVVRGGIIQTFSANPALVLPMGVSLAADGSLFVANREAAPVVKLSTAGGATTLKEYAGDVVAIAAGALYLSDRDVVRAVGASGAAITVAGARNYTFAGDGGLGAAARLNGPYALALSAAGELYIADMLNHRVRRIDASGTITTVAGNGEPARIDEPAGLAVSAEGKLYVADRQSHRVLVVEGDTLRTVAGTGAAGFTPDGKLPTSTSLNSPHGLAFDNAGNLYIADTGNHRILKLTRTGTLTTVAGGGADPLDEPRGIAVEPSGTLLIADTGNGRLRRLGPAGTLTDACDRRLSLVRGVTVRADGVIFIAESGANRVVAILGTGEARVIAGTGERGYDGDGGLAIDARFDAPMDVLALADGSIAVADFANNRVRRLQATATIGTNRAPIRVVHAATQIEQAVAPGQLITIYDSPLSGAATRVSISGRPARVLYARDGQINLHIPVDVSANTRAELRIFDDTDAVSSEITIVPAAPGIFTLSTGRGQAAVTNENGSANSQSSPADAGSVVTLYATGIPTGAPLEVEIASRAAEVLYVTAAPGAPGVRQIAARVPSVLSPGNALLVVRVGSAESQPGVTVAVR
jgi:trimeric autotransporter adhesin